MDVVFLVGAAVMFEASVGMLISCDTLSVRK